MAEMNLILDCLNNPDDEAPRLMLADYAQERGNDRAVEVLGLTRKLVLAIDDPAYDWVPPVEIRPINLGANPPLAPEGQRSVNYIQKDGIWYWNQHRPQPWLPSRRPKYLGRAFATAVVRWLGSQSYSNNGRKEFGRISTPCELSAAGLIDHRVRDQWIAKTGLYTKGRLFESAEHNGYHVVWKVCCAARSGTLGHVQHVVFWGTKDARQLFQATKSRDPKNINKWHQISWEFATTKCLDRIHCTPLLRMVGCLRRHLGLS